MRHSDIYLWLICVKLLPEEGKNMFFSDDYFNREVICNFEVSEMMKRAWAAQIEVLQIVIDVCKKHNLQYFADWGTLLGAVRHNGFIPWDDDIDICLKRDDYNKLISILKDELPKGFAIMGMFADTEEMRLAAEVTHLRVVADDSWNFNDYMRYFHGFPYQRVGIDIFPIDYIPNNTSEAELQKEIVKQGLFVLGQWDNLKKKGELDECLRRYLDMCNIYPQGEKDIKNWLWKLVDRICSLYSYADGDYMVNYPACILEHEYKMKKEWYDDAIEMPFENITIAVPIGYDGVLKAQFGDYMTPVQGTADHAYPFYKDMQRELGIRIKKSGFDGSVDEFCRAVAEGKIQIR